MQASIDERNDDGRQRSRENRQSEDDQRYDEKLCIRSGRADIAISHRRHGDDREIERRRPVLDRGRELVAQHHRSDHRVSEQQEDTPDGKYAGGRQAVFAERSAKQPQQAQQDRLEYQHARTQTDIEQRCAQEIRNDDDHGDQPCHPRSQHQAKCHAGQEYARDRLFRARRDSRQQLTRHVDEILQAETTRQQLLAKAAEIDDPDDQHRDPQGDLRKPAQRGQAIENTALRSCFRRTGFGPLFMMLAHGLPPVSHGRSNVNHLDQRGARAGLYLTSSTCSNSSSTGVARPKIDTETLTFCLSKSSSSTSPLKLAKGPSSTLT